MNSCKNFSKTHPILLAILAFAFIFGIVELTVIIPNGPLAMGLREFMVAVCVFIVTFLFMGKEKVSFSTKGLGYAFRILCGYYIFMIIFSALCSAALIFNSISKDGGFSYSIVTFINILITGLCVGVAEEFIFRGLVFGGLLQKFNNTKKGIILAFIYYKTRNIFVVAILHSLDDFLLFVVGSLGDGKVGSYVATDGKVIKYVIIYSLFTLILVPALIKCIRDIKSGEAIPFDDDFLPRKVVFEKKSKKKK